MISSVARNTDTLICRQLLGYNMGSKTDFGISNVQQNQVDSLHCILPYLPKSLLSRPAVVLSQTSTDINNQVCALVTFHPHNTCSGGFTAGKLFMLLRPSVGELPCYDADHTIHTCGMASF